MPTKQSQAMGRIRYTPRPPGIPPNALANSGAERQQMHGGSKSA